MLFAEAVGEVAEANQLKKQNVIVKNAPLGTETYFWSGYGGEGTTVSVTCSPGVLRAVVRDRSIDPFGTVRTRSHVRVAEELSEVLNQWFAARSGSFSLS